MKVSCKRDVIMLTSAILHRITWSKNEFDFFWKNINILLDYTCSKLSLRLWQLDVDLVNSKRCTNVWKLLNSSDLQKIAKTFSKNAIQSWKIVLQGAFEWIKLYLEPMSVRQRLPRTGSAEPRPQSPLVETLAWL